VAGVSSAAAAAAALDQLQSAFCISRIGGDIHVLDRAQIQAVQIGNKTTDVHYFTKQHGDLLMHRYLESLDFAPRPKDVINDFWVSPATFMYDAVAFSPCATPDATLNYWIGPTVKGIRGDADPIAEFLFNVICNENKVSFDYLIEYLAHCLQSPEQKPGVCVVLLGGQGTGKGVFFQLLRKIWSHTTLLINDMDGVTGRFNAALEKNFLVCMDEALFVGDKKALDRLKSLITESVIRIEEKYQPSRSIESFHRFFAASNHDQFTTLEKDDRRFFFLRVSSSRQQDTEYFEKLVHSFDDGKTIPAFVHHLLRIRLELDIRKRPETPEHQDQKLKSLTGFERFWHEVLCSGNLTGTGRGFESKEWEEAMFMATAELVSSYTFFDTQATKYGTVQTKYVRELITKMCPSAVHERKTIYGKQSRGFDLPCIETARDEFASYVGCHIRWDD
jgi:hypothetical protein